MASSYFVLLLYGSRSLFIIVVAMDGLALERSNPRMAVDGTLAV